MRRGLVLVLVHERAWGLQPLPYVDGAPDDERAVRIERGRLLDRDHVSLDGVFGDRATYRLRDFPRRAVAARGRDEDPDRGVW